MGDKQEELRKVQELFDCGFIGENELAERRAAILGTSAIVGQPQPIDQPQPTDYPTPPPPPPPLPPPHFEAFVHHPSPPPSPPQPREPSPLPPRNLREDGEDAPVMVEGVDYDGQKIMVQLPDYCVKIDKRLAASVQGPQASVPIRRCVAPMPDGLPVNGALLTAIHCPANMVVAVTRSSTGRVFQTVPMECGVVSHDLIRALPEACAARSIVCAKTGKIVQGTRCTEPGFYRALPEPAVLVHRGRWTAFVHGNPSELEPQWRSVIERPQWFGPKPETHLYDRIYASAELTAEQKTWFQPLKLPRGGDSDPEKLLIAATVYFRQLVGKGDGERANPEQFMSSLPVSIVRISDLLIAREKAGLCLRCGKGSAFGGHMLCNDHSDDGFCDKLVAMVKRFEMWPLFRGEHGVAPERDLCRTEERFRYADFRSVAKPRVKGILVQIVEQLFSS